jgi:serine/threonine-protein kinase
MNVFLKPGDRFLEYRLLEIIGEGGMGIVFKAIEDRSEDIVAIKCLLPCHADREDFAARFEEECKFYPKLKHLNIVRMRRTGVAQLPAPAPPIPFIVMDLLEGKTLRKILNRYHRLDYLNTLNILIQIADPMRVAHDKGIVHRDLKPENIMVGSNGDEKGHVWIMDFGIAKDVHRGLNTEDMPDMGTARYMAPEQVRNVFNAGKRGKREKVDHRADIYAFGCIAYEIVTGRHYFINDNDPPTFEETLAGHLVAEPMPIYKIVPECPEHMEDLWLIIGKCLAKDPDERYQSFDEVLADLQDRIRASVPPTHPLGRRAIAEKTRSARRAAFASLATEPSTEVRKDPEPSGREALTPEPPAPVEAVSQPSEAATRAALAPTAPAPPEEPPEVATSDAPSAPSDAPERGTIPLVNFVPRANPLPFVPPAAPFVPSVPLLKPARGVGCTMKLQRPEIPLAGPSPAASPHASAPPRAAEREAAATSRVPAPPQALLKPGPPAEVAFAMPAAPPPSWNTTAGTAAGVATATATSLAGLPQVTPPAPRFGPPPTPQGGIPLAAVVPASAFAPMHQAPSSMPTAVGRSALQGWSPTTAPAGQPAGIVVTSPRPTPATPSAMSTSSSQPSRRRHLFLAPLVGLALVLAASAMLLLFARPPARSAQALAASASAQPGSSAAVAPATADPPSTGLPAETTPTPASVPTVVPTEEASAHPSAPPHPQGTAAPAPAASTRAPQVAPATPTSPKPARAPLTAAKQSSARTPVIPLVGD